MLGRIRTCQVQVFMVHLDGRNCETEGKLDISSLSFSLLCAFKHEKVISGYLPRQKIEEPAGISFPCLLESHILRLMKNEKEYWTAKFKKACVVVLFFPIPLTIPNV